MYADPRQAPSGFHRFALDRGAEHYASELAREEREIVDAPEREADEVMTILQSYGVDRGDAAAVVAAMRRAPDKWRDFMMRFELGLEEPDPKRALRSALTILPGRVPFAAPHRPERRLGLSDAVKPDGVGH